MANKKISDFTEVTSVGDSDWLEIETAAGNSRKVKKANLTGLIGYYATGAGESSVSFPTIPTVYNHLKIISMSGTVAANSTSSGGLVVRFNGDSAAAQYAYTIGGSYGSGSFFGVGSASATFAQIGYNPSTGTAGIPLGETVVTIANFQSSNPKWVVGNTGCLQSNTGPLQGSVSAYWKGTAAITSLVLSDRDGGNFATGSKFWLYGIM